jgi:hypothetical protein
VVIVIIDLDQYWGKYTHRFGSILGFRVNTYHSLLLSSSSSSIWINIGISGQIHSSIWINIGISGQFVVVIDLDQYWDIGDRSKWREDKSVKKISLVSLSFMYCECESPEGSFTLQPTGPAPPPWTSHDDRWSVVLRSLHLRGLP